MSGHALRGFGCQLYKYNLNGTTLKMPEDAPAQYEGTEGMTARPRIDLVLNYPRDSFPAAWISSKINVGAPTINRDYRVCPDFGL